MSNLREAAQQALEFLDAEFGWSPVEASSIAALRAALAQPEPAAPSMTTTADDILTLAHVYAIKGDYEPFRAAVDSLVAERDALAQFAQSAKNLQLVANLIDEYGLEALEVIAALAQPEPQSTHSAECYQWHHRCAVVEVERLRAAPRAALSDAELACLYIKHARCQEEGPITSGWFDFARAVEAAIKEKQND